MVTPILETERILLRPLKISDAEAVYNNWATDTDVTKYVRWNNHRSIDVTLEWLTSLENNIESDKSYDWGFLLKETGEVFGSGGVFYNDEHKMFEIGYVTMKKYLNKGLTTEAAKAIVDFAVNELKQTELYARHAKENIASGKVMEKCGFVYHSDGEYSSFDGTRTFKSRECFLSLNK